MVVLKYIFQAAGVEEDAKLRGGEGGGGKSNFWLSCPLKIT